MHETGDMLTDETAAGVVEAGATTGTLQVATVDDQMDELDSMVTATLKSSAAYRVGDPDSATGEVTDNDNLADASKPLVTIEAINGEVSSGASVRFTVTADPAPTNDLVVEINWTDRGMHLAEPPPASVTVSQGNTTAPVTAATVTGGSATHRTVTAKLFSDDKYRLGTPNSADVTITG